MRLGAPQRKIWVSPEPTSESVRSQAGQFRFRVYRLLLQFG
jgi:hypothetical protein